MVVVDDVDPAVGQVHLAGARHGIGCQDRDAKSCDHIRQIMVAQGVILIRPRSQHNGIAAFPSDLADDVGAGLLKIPVKCMLGLVGGLDGQPRDRRCDAEGLIHVTRQLPVSVFRLIPVEKRRIKGDIPALFRVI